MNKMRSGVFVGLVFLLSGCVENGNRDNASAPVVEERLGQEFASTERPQSTNNGSSDPGEDPPDNDPPRNRPNGGIGSGANFRAGVATIGMATFDQVYSMMVSSTGLQQVSPETVQVYQDYRATLLTSSDSSQLSEVVVQSTVAIASYVCRDLVLQEAAQANGVRRFFGGMNLSPSGTAGLDDVKRRQVLDLLSLHAWSRLMTTSEKAHILDGLSDAGLGAGTLDQQEIRNAAHFMCVATLSSFSAQEL